MNNSAHILTVLISIAVILVCFIVWLSVGVGLDYWKKRGKKP